MSTRPVAICSWMIMPRVIAPITISLIEPVGPTSNGTKYAPMWPNTSCPRSSMFVNSNGSRLPFETMRMTIASSKRLTSAVVPSAKASQTADLVRMANSAIAGANAARPSSSRTGSGGRGGGRSCTLAMLVAVAVPPGGRTPTGLLRLAEEAVGRRAGRLVASRSPMEPSVCHRCDKRSGACAETPEWDG